MTHGPLRTVLHHLRRTTAGASTDAALLERFRADRDPAAFEAIVRRHGRMVWGVCRRGVGCDADADDAFQATFLVLAKRPENVRKPDALASWLHGVAGRVVQKSRALAARRSAVERAAPPRTSTVVPDALEQSELRAILDEELARLPEKYRLPVLLCYYEGLTNEEAAKQLGWPHGTVCGRLARARTLLHDRLSRRGIAVPVVIAALSATVNNRELRAGLVTMTLSAVSDPAKLALSTTVMVLTEGVLRMLWLGKLKLVMAVGLSVVILAGATGWALRPVAAEQPPAAPRHDPFAQPKEDRETAMRTLYQKRLECAATEYEARFKEYEAGRGTLALLFDCGRRLLDSELALCKTSDDRVAAYKKYKEATDKVRELNQARFEAGRVPIQDLEQSRYYTFDAWIMLFQAETQAQREAEKEKKK